MKTIKKAQNGVKQKPKPVTGPTFVNFRMANEKTGTGLPGTRQDSLDYKKGWQRGLKGNKPSAMEKKYQGENEYEKMGRWEGQNKVKKNSVKKAQNGVKTADSTAYFKRKAAEAVFERGRTRNRNIVNKSSASKKAQDDKSAVDKINNLNESVTRQAKKGKPGYDKNGYPKKKAKTGTSVKKCKYGCK